MEKKAVFCLLIYVTSNRCRGSPLKSLDWYLSVALNDSIMVETRHGMYFLSPLQASVCRLCKRPCTMQIK
jgi:hypothetical protein